MMKPEVKELTSKDAAKERLHLVLMQDRANVSVDFLELMKQEIIDVIKKYIVIDESSIDVRLTNKENEDGTNGAPSLYANIPIVNIKNDILVEKKKEAEAAKVENVRVETVEQINENNGGNQGKVEYIEKNNLPIHQFIISSSSSLGFVENEILENAHVSISKISKFGQYRDRILNKEYEYLSIVPYNTNKSNAIKFLSNYLSIDNTDVMAIGDNLNDVDMVKCIFWA